MTDKPDESTVPTPETAAETPVESAPEHPIAAAVRPGYAFEGTALELGGLMLDATTLTDVRIRIPLGMLNRHGLVAGATGTGKTKTLQLLAEQLSAHGVPVFAADIKGDLSGLSVPGEGERQDRRPGPGRSASSGRRPASRWSSTPSAARASASRCA